jgi:hypothetical protein
MGWDGGRRWIVKGSPAPADAGEATAAQKSKNLYHALRGTNVCTFVPRISSAPFFWGVITSFDRVYTSSSAAQCERIGPPEGRFLTQFSDCLRSNLKFGLRRSGQKSKLSTDGGTRDARA